MLLYVIDRLNELVATLIPAPTHAQTWWYTYNTFSLITSCILPE